MSIELGCGLIAIGREWGTTPTVPSEAEVHSFLRDAYDSGIRFFDTAPSYGLSEERLGAFLNTLTFEERAEVSVATKFGEHWDGGSGTAYADHSFEALKRSLDQSVRYLGSLAVLQLHKATLELLRSDDVMQGFEYARGLGIDRLGASVSDLKTAKAVLLDERLSVLQLPYNPANTQFQEVVRAARDHDTTLITNRPFEMGAVMAKTDDKETAAANSFHFILQEAFDGVILTGTSNIEHLHENLTAFRTAENEVNG